MKAGSLVTKNEPWKDHFHFGEEILNLSSSNEQIQYISDYLTQHFSCSIKVWLAAPFFPLPGQPPVDTLPSRSAPDWVKRSQNRKEIVTHRSPSPIQFNLAIPLKTHDSVLGIVELAKHKKDFSSEEISSLEGYIASAAISLQISRQITIKNWRSDQLSLVSKVSREVANIHDLDLLARKVVRLIHDEFHYYYLAFYLLNETGNELVINAQTGDKKTQSQIANQSFKIGEGMVGASAERRCEIIANDIRLEPLSSKEMRLPRTQAEVALPMIIDNRILGVLDIQADQKNVFHELDMVALRSLADNVAVAIENTRLFSDLQKRSNRLSAILEVNHTLSSILDLDELLKSIVDLIHEHFKYPLVRLYTLDSSLSKLEYRTGSSYQNTVGKTQKAVYDLEDENSIIPYVAQTGKTFITGDTENHEFYREFLSTSADSVSVLAIPLIYGKDTLGVLDIQSDQLNAFNTEDQNLIEGLASGIALSIRNATLYRSEKWRRRVADGFREIAGLITSNVEINRILEKILLEIESNLPCDASAIWLLERSALKEDLKNHELHLSAVRGVEAERIITLRKEDPKIKDWLSSALDCCDAHVRKISDPYGPLGAALAFPEDYSSIAVPLIAGNQVLGILTLAHHLPDRYGNEAIAMTTTHANYAAAAIQNAQLFTEAQSQAWISTVLLQVSESTQDIDSIDELLENMARLSPMLIGLSRCAFLLWDDKKHTLEINASFGLDLVKNGEIIHEEKAPLLRSIRIRNKYSVVSDVVVEMGFPQLALDPMEKMIVFPMASRGIYEGAFIVVLNKEQSSSLMDAFDDQTISILQGMASQTAMALENIKLLEMQKEDAYVTAVLLQVSQAVTSQNELEDILATIIHLIPILVGIDTAILYGWNPEHAIYDPLQVFASDKTLEMDILANPIPAGKAQFFDQVIEKDRHISIPVQESATLPLSWSGLTAIDEMGQTSIAEHENSAVLHALPIKISGIPLGILLALEPKFQSQFYEKRMEILAGISQNIALAIQNDRMQKEMIERQRLDQEVEVARKIQITFLPESLPILPGWQLASRWLTARQVGGDFYDVINLGEGKYGFVIADVSDKGIPAALFMTVSRTLIRAYAEQHKSPAKVLSLVNQLLQRDTPDNSFVTAVYGVLDTKTGELTYSNAGHNLPYWIHSQTGLIEALPGGNIAMGVLHDAEYVDHLITMENNDSLIMYTDGVTDAFDPSGESYGETHLINAIKKNHEKGIEKMLDGIERDIKNFTNGATPSDDITILGIKFRGY